MPLSATTCVTQRCKSAPALKTVSVIEPWHRSRRDAYARVEPSSNARAHDSLASIEGLPQSYERVSARARCRLARQCRKRSATSQRGNMSIHERTTLPREGHARVS